VVVDGLDYSACERGAVFVPVFGSYDDEKTCNIVVYLELGIGYPFSIFIWSLFPVPYISLHLKLNVGSTYLSQLM
jgi:hypothetical protein